VLVQERAATHSYLQALDIVHPANGT
jgi:hypothetical protein